MRVALIYPPYNHKIFSENLQVVDEEFCFAPPIILAYVAAILEKHGHIVKILDARALAVGKEQALEILTEFNPDILGFRAETYHFHDALEWIGFLKSKLKKPVFAGGPNLTLYPEETMSHAQIDYGVIGEAIESLPKLLEALSVNKDLSGIAGIAYKQKDNKVIVNKPDAKIFDFNDYPYPARHLLANEKYYSFISQRKNFTIMLTSTGCPFTCVFCAIPSVYRIRAAQSVVNEIEFCYREYNIREIDFFDAIFFMDKTRSLEIMRKLQELNLDLEWSCRSRVDLVDAEILEAARNAGCRQIYYGIESINQSVLNNINKRISISDVKKAIFLTKKYGIRTMGFFMVGNEGDTPDSVRETIKFAKILDLDFIQVCQVIAKPGTELHLRLNKTIGIDLWQEHVLGNELKQRLPTPWSSLTEQEILSLTQEFYFKFYFSFKTIAKLLFRLKSFTELRRYLRAGINFFIQKVKFYALIFTDTAEAAGMLSQSKYFLKSAKEKKVAIVMPTYNEKDNIRLICNKIHNVLSNAFILIIDDNSPDGTGKLATEMALADERIKVIHRAEKQGLGTAYINGFKYILSNIDADYIFEMDADFSHDPEYLPIFLYYACFYDLVLGSRFLRRVSIKNRRLWRNLISKTTKWGVNLLLGTSFSDVTSGYKCYRRSLLRKIDWEHIGSKGYAFQIESLCAIRNIAASIKEIPIIFCERQRGRSKISLEIFREAIALVLKLSLRRFIKIKPRDKKPRGVAGTMPAAIRKGKDNEN
ncbi:MAG: glycosyltransferase [Candidatus Omnitrophota bacterium]